MHYGWIPTLTSKLQFSQAVRESRRDFVSTSVRNHFLTYSAPSDLSRCRAFFGEEVINSIREYFTASPTDQLVLYLKVLDDISTNDFTAIAIAIGEDDKVTKVAFFDHPNLTHLASAHICFIEDTGLVSYQVDSEYPHIFAKQLFGEVRDLYHEHVYADHGDFALLPVNVEEGGRSTAIQKIFDQYDSKISSYHRVIKDGIDELRDAYALRSSRNFLDVSMELSSAIGEMSYALSFVSLFELPRKEENCIRNALASFTNLTEKYNQLVSLKSIAVTWKNLVLTIAVSALAAFEFSRYLSPEHPIGVSIAITIVVVGLILFQSYKSTSKK